MGFPLGKGESRHPRDGNATLTTHDLDGKKVHTPLWLDQFATDLNLQLDSGQLRTGLVHRPIRVSERFLIFSTLWNVIDRPKYVRLIKVIREHWAFNLNENARVTPMKLQYYGANKTWLGFVEGASIAFAVTDVVLSYQFQMRLVPSLAGPISQVGGVSSPLSPTSADARGFGPEWYKMGEFIANIVGVGNEGKNGARDGHRDPITGSGGSAKK